MTEKEIKDAKAYIRDVRNSRCSSEFKERCYLNIVIDYIAQLEASLVEARKDSGRLDFLIRGVAEIARSHGIRLEIVRSKIDDAMRQDHYDKLEEQRNVSI